MSETNETGKALKLGGLPWWQAVIAIILCAIPMYWGIQSRAKQEHSVPVMLLD